MNKVEVDEAPFLYTYIRPISDWFEEVKVEIQKDDYYYFRLERRYGPSWWLIGKKPKEEPKYHWEEKQIGEISEADIRRFIEWAKTGNGSKITEIKAICGAFDIIDEISNIGR